MPPSPHRLPLRTLSAPRFAPYLRHTAGDADRAGRLYWWNIEAAGAFYGPLHCLEVALRNALHDCLAAHFGRADWWEAAPLKRPNRHQVRAAEAKARTKTRGRWTADDVVAELSFGFWVSLLSRGYDRHLWRPALDRQRAFPQYRGSRGDLHDGLLSLVYLRNRIMHHEPVHARDLAADHVKICRMLGFLSVDLADRVVALARVTAVLSRKEEVCSGLAEPSF
ncbi:hypothetical protein [Actinocorallia sp. A-T 12471]|uniref:hypothetical protein n=1 Tax=Actinocorallia sp. A-T 12471 TaxID=3089813 RepID=UPI0029CD9FCB|nr:hypothetical protein [Actinocorallia sp. A-T 12471]MDX6743047.1 hypothetical protein [Actinocorallia sp. A-T 12471]